jgi:hypothetical protein
MNAVFTPRELLFIVGITCVVAILDYVVYNFSLLFSFYFSLAAYLALANFLQLITEKKVVYLLVGPLLGSITFFIPDLLISGWPKILFLFFTSLPLFFLTSTYSWGRVVGGGFAALLLPLLASFYLAPGSVATLSIPVFNLVAISCITGIAATTVTFFLWQFIGNTKMMVKLRAFLSSSE